MKKTKLFWLFCLLVLLPGLGIQKALAVTSTVSSLGGLQLNEYCVHLNQVNSNPINSINWQCNPGGVLIDMNLACQWQYNDPNAFGKQADTNNQYTWACYTSPTPPPTASPTPTPTATPHSQALRVFNATGQELGIFMGDNAFFNETLGRRVVLNGGGDLIKTVKVYFTQPNCLGTAFNNNSDLQNDVLSVGSGGNHYLIQFGANKNTIVTQSDQQFDSVNGIVCTNRTETLTDAYPLSPVTLPFSVPVALPLQIKYQ